MKLRIVLVFLGLFAVGLIAALMSQVPPPPGPYPSPNAYATYVSAAERVKSIPEDYFTTSDIDKLRESIEFNQSVLDALEQAASEDCQVPITEYASVAQAIETASQTRMLSHLMVTKARLEQLEGKPDEAARTYSDLFILSARLAKGGLLVHQLSAMSGKRIAVEKLGELAADLSDSTRIEIAEQIESNSLADVPVEEQISKVMRREVDTAKRQQGVLSVTISRLLGGEEPAVRQFRDRLNENIRLETDLISRLRENTNGSGEKSE
ncbi:MAG: hypothetical protein AAF802_02335 [Planctomycetota bacterium]